MPDSLTQAWRGKKRKKQNKAIPNACNFEFLFKLIHRSCFCQLTEKLIRKSIKESRHPIRNRLETVEEDVSTGSRRLKLLLRQTVNK